VLEQFSIRNVKAIDRVHRWAGSETNEWGHTGLWHGEEARSELTSTAYPVFIHYITAGLVAPFSPFFHAILWHYQI
jgi:hypothetical protein